MISEILVGAAVWLASNPTGRKVAKTSYRVLTQVGNQVVKALPNEISGVFCGTEKFFANVANMAADDGQEKIGG